MKEESYPSAELPLVYSGLIEKQPPTDPAVDGDNTRDFGDYLKGFCGRRDAKKVRDPLRSWRCAEYSTSKLFRNTSNSPRKEINLTLSRSCSFLTYGVGWDF